MASAGEPSCLNTPRQVYDDQQQLRWKWDQAEPFGVTPVDENPLNLGAFEMPLRFAGQYSDKEHGQFYNYFRSYDAGLGRYMEADPLGVFGTEMRPTFNLYAYVNGEPLSLIDPFGLYTLKAGVPTPSARVALLLTCIENCYGTSFVVTATTNDHGAKTPHGRGQAADIRYPSDPAKFMCCASNCGAGFGLDEKLNPSSASTAAHLHIQIPPGTRGGRGDLPPAQCKPSCP
jgi:RHS repeat-associated protein